ncbi:MAG: hypothetical protein WC868_01480 [Bacteroidales bacterium]
MTLMIMICTDFIRDYQLNQCYPRQNDSVGLVCSIKYIPTLDSHLS